MTLSRWLFSIACLTVATGTGAKESPDYRLPAEVVPTSQRIELRIDPAKAGFSGRTRIELIVGGATERIGIHQRGLDMTSITLAAGDEVRELSATVADYDINWLADGKPIPAGRYTLRIDYEGEHSTEPLGAHRVDFEGNRYVFTQFEAMYGRRAIPLFDEPTFKIPFQVTIRAPDDQVVLSNTPVSSRTVTDGWQRVEFLVTPRIPSYLLAYAVGPFDRAPIDDLSVPAFIYTPKGHAGEAGFVQRETPKIVAALENYFGSDYPFRKLDFVAVPDFAFGAMENPGLITYRIEYLLTGDEVKGQSAAWILNVVTHEVAHQWFGNLVTMNWWNDLWLNEAFTSWIADKTVERLYPEYRNDLKLSQSQAFAADQRLTAKPIRKNVRTQDDAFEDVGLNYTKGAAILRMLESFVGGDVWRDGVRLYMSKHARGNASEFDLWAAISVRAGLDIGRVARPYLNQPGFALVDVGSTGRVTQQRYLAEAVKGPDFYWPVPLNVKYKHDGEIYSTTYLLNGQSGRIDVPAGADWILPDAGANGYFRWAVTPAHFEALVADLDELADREKIGVLDNTDALLTAGRLSLGDYLLVIDKLLNDPQPLVLLPALEKLKSIGDTLVDSENRDLFATLVDRKLAPRFREIGITEQPEDSETLLQLRPRLLRILGQYGADPEARLAAIEIAERFFASPKAVTRDLAREALRVTALNDDGSRYGKYIQAYVDADSDLQKTTILSSIYFADKQTIRRHLDFTLTPAVTAGNLLFGIYYLADVLEDHAIIYDWLRDNTDAYFAKLPDNYEVNLPQYLVGVCTPVNLDLMQNFFAEQEERFSVSLEKAVETVETCLAKKARHREAISVYLQKYAPAEAAGF